MEHENLTFRSIFIFQSVVWSVARSLAKDRETRGFHWGKKLGDERKCSVS